MVGTWFCWQESLNSDHFTVQSVYCSCHPETHLTHLGGVLRVVGLRRSGEVQRPWERGGGAPPAWPGALCLCAC